MKPKPIRLYFRVAMMLLMMLLTSAQMATAQEAAVYDLVTEVPDVDGGQSTNWNTEYDYYSLVDGNTSTVYGISNANPWVEFHYTGNCPVFSLPEKSFLRLSYTKSAYFSDIQ